MSVPSRRVTWPFGVLLNLLLVSWTEINFLQYHSCISKEIAPFLPAIEIVLTWDQFHGIISVLRQYLDAHKRNMNGTAFTSSINIINVLNPLQLKKIVLGKMNVYKTSAIIPVARTSIKSTEQAKQDRKELIIVIVIVSLTLSIVGITNNEEDIEGIGLVQREAPEEKHITDLRNSILACNDIEADRVQVLPAKVEDTVEIEKIYIPVIITDESEKCIVNMNDKENMRKITLDKIFNTDQKNLARFIFMLGEAGYGKTVQCQWITKSWCQAWQNESSSNSDTGLEICLKQFDFLFFVKMCNAHKAQTSLIDIILDAYRPYRLSKDRLDGIRKILEDGEYKSLILLDGLDEWNIFDGKWEELYNQGIPNCGNIPNCTILMTMRAWKFIEIQHLRRQKVDKLVLLQGFNENGIKSLIERMFCNYLEKETYNEESNMKYERLQNAASKSLQTFKSLMKIPFLAVFCFLTWSENAENVYSKTTFYLALIETLIMRYLAKGKSDTQRNEVINQKISDVNISREYRLVIEHLSELSSIGKIVFSRSSSKNERMIFKSEELNDIFGQETLAKFLKMGLFSKQTSSGKVYHESFELRFLHKTVKEFLASLYLWKEGAIIESFVNIVIKDIDTALDFSTILTFLSGLSPADGCRISRYIADLASDDHSIRSFRDYFSPESYEKVQSVYNLQVQCYREVRGEKSIKQFLEDGQKLSYTLSDIILHGSSDKHIIRETADILRYHANDIKSLQMKLIADDAVEGISNEELQYFLDQSRSLKSFDLDGDATVNCRIFHHFSNQLSSLYSLGLHNVELSDNILVDLLKHNLNKTPIKRTLKTLGLTSIKRGNVQFSSKPLPTKGSRRNKVKRTSSLQRLQDRESYEKIPILKDVLRSLPEFEVLSTLHVSYMESSEDREMLLKVLPLMRQLYHFGYHGGATSGSYDGIIVEVIMKMTYLKTLFLSKMILHQELVHFRRMLQLERIRLQTLKMNKMVWEEFVVSLSTLTESGHLIVILCDTDIDTESVTRLQILPRLLTILTDEKSSW
ncbi:hypothetical protein FSP39_006200 [Pinctada imbricata]|uniref:NACHT domain-containing protein n=1 Tax=Pinctada imbricata TaxID=66713 RepID=A0AA88Y7G3_PINIB|nr:hypothetical protein FSP39_006200 [Pinctada imbricata]